MAANCDINRLRQRQSVQHSIDFDVMQTTFATKAIGIVLLLFAPHDCVKRSKPGGKFQTHAPAMQKDSSHGAKCVFEVATGDNAHIPGANFLRNIEDRIESRNGT